MEVKETKTGGDREKKISPMFLQTKRQEDTEEIALQRVFIASVCAVL